MSEDPDNNAVNKVHEQAEKLEKDAINYTKKGVDVGLTARNSANPDINNNAKEEEKKKDILALLGRMAEIAKEARQYADKMRDNLDNMGAVLDEMDTALDKARKQAERVNRIGKALQNKDPAEMAETLIYLGFDLEEVAAMDENAMIGNLQSEYNETLSAYEHSLAFLDQKSSEYYAERDDYLANREQLQTRIDELEKLDTPEARQQAEQFKQERDQMDDDFDKYEERMQNDIVAKRNALPDIEDFNKAHKTHRQNNSDNRDFNELSLGAVRGNRQETQAQLSSITDHYNQMAEGQQPDKTQPDIEQKPLAVDEPVLNTSEPGW